MPGGRWPWLEAALRLLEDSAPMPPVLQDYTP